MCRKTRDEKVFEEYLTERTGEAVTLNDHIREVLGSNPGRNTGYPYSTLAPSKCAIKPRLQLADSPFIFTSVRSYIWLLIASLNNTPPTILWHVEPLLGNDQISIYTTAVTEKRLRKQACLHGKHLETAREEQCFLCGPCFNVISRRVS
jgi:hypothetical protein